MDMTKPASEAGAALRYGLIGLIFFATALNYVDRQVLALLKPTLVQEFNWTDQDFAHLGSAFQLSAAFALLGVGWFVDRFGVRVAYGLAVAVWSAAGMAHALAASVQQFLAARVVLAVAESCNTPAAMKAAATYLPMRERALGIGIINTAPNIGAILTPLLIPPLALAFGWKAAFLVTGALGFVWLALWLGATRRLPARHTTAKRSPGASVREILKDRRAWSVIGAKALTDLVWWFVLFWMPDFFHREFGMDQGQLGYPIAIIFLFAAVGAVSSGGLFVFLEARGLGLNKARKYSMLFYALAILPMPLALSSGNPWLAAVLIGLGLFAHQGFSTGIFGMATDTVPTRQLATVIAFGGIAGNLTGTGMIEFAGWSLHAGLGYTPMFAVCSGAYLAALALIHVLQPRMTLADPEG